MRFNAVVFMSFAVLLALAGCNGRTEPKVGKNFDELHQLRDVDVSTLQEGLGVGDLAPEIIGADSQGVSFALSDYRGKVVMLDFWGDW